MPHRSGSLESLRELNRLRVVEALRRHGTLSRADIARTTGLSRSTISTLVADLHRRGFVAEGEVEGSGSSRSSTVGRPPVMLRLDPPAGIAVGIDFDHTRVRVVVSDLSRTVLSERVAELDVDHDAARALEVSTELVHRALDESGFCADLVLAIGVALPGPVDQARRRLHDTEILEDWTGVDPAAVLGERLGAPVHIDNDANLGALAEVTLGAGRSAGTAVFVQLSSGVGAGLIVDGRPFRGASGVAGEIGHVTVASPGQLCRCGRRGCLETLVSGPAIVEQLRARRGELLAVPDIIGLAHDGDADCRAVIAEAGRRVGAVVADVCNVLNPDTVVIGGELSAAGDLLLGPLRAALVGNALPAITRELVVVAGELGDRANSLGALALAIAHSEQAVAARIRTPGPGRTP